MSSNSSSSSLIKVSVASSLRSASASLSIKVSFFFHKFYNFELALRLDCLKEYIILSFDLASDVRCLLIRLLDYL
jgi:hypothetical protein